MCFKLERKMGGGEWVVREESSYRSNVCVEDKVKRILCGGREDIFGEMVAEAKNKRRTGSRYDEHTSGTT